jgi:hypothetical protein
VPGQLPEHLDVLRDEGELLGGICGKRVINLK